MNNLRSEMTPQSAKLKPQVFRVSPVSLAADPVTAHRLADEDKTEVLRFLEERPLHTVVMNGFIRDNGLESRLNRGTFYGCRNQAGKLEGVALLGHAIFLESRTEAALRIFAGIAQDCANTHMIMGEDQTVQTFWEYYSQGGQLPRLFCRETLLELTSPVQTFASVPNLRRATGEDLSLVAPVHAALAFEESGVNPLNVDPDGFQARCRRRIDQGRIWIWIEDGRVIFKADLISDTPEAIYIEGVYVDANERGKGYGKRCLLQMSTELLGRTRSITVLVNEKQREARRFFHTVGFVSRGVHQTIFLQGSKAKQ
jgi:predicted GNAT family acetyltransferase